MNNIVDRLNQTDFESFVFFNELVRDVADYLDENVEMHYDINASRKCPKNAMIRPIQSTNCAAVSPHGTSIS